MNHPEVFIGITVFLLAYLFIWAKTKHSLVKKKKIFQKRPMRFMFLFLTTWLLALLSNIVLAFLILGITWGLQAIHNNPIVHDYSMFMFNGMLFINHGLIYLLLFVSFMVIALVSFFICVNRIKFVSTSDAKKNLSTVTEGGIWYWMYKNRYCASSPALIPSRKKVNLSLAAGVSPNALAITNLMLVVISMVVVVLACELSPVLKP
jgi:hypothetical protein